MLTFYFSIEENGEGKFRAQNCKLHWAHKVVNQTLCRSKSILYLEAPQSRKKNNKKKFEKLIFLIPAGSCVPAYL